MIDPFNQQLHEATAFPGRHLFPQRFKILSGLQDFDSTRKGASSFRKFGVDLNQPLLSTGQLFVA